MLRHALNALLRSSHARQRKEKNRGGPMGRWIRPRGGPGHQISILNRYVLNGWEEVSATRSRMGRSWPSDFLNRENAREERDRRSKALDLHPTVRTSSEDLTAR